MTGRTSPRVDSPPSDAIVRRLRGFAPRSARELELVLPLCARRDRLPPGEELLLEGDTARRPRFVVSGWASAQRVLPDSRRQVFGVLLPGDGIAVYPRMAPPAPFTVVATTALETVDAEPFLEAIRLDSPAPRQRPLATR